MSCVDRWNTVVYVHVMSDDHLAQLATWQQLAGFAILSAVCVALIMAGTYTGNSDIYDRIGQEMKKLGKAIRFTAVMLPGVLLILTDMALRVLDSPGRHFA